MSYILVFLLIFQVAHSKVEVLFHPTDPTLETIAQWVAEAQKEVDIAMYNMDTSDRSPVIQTLKSGPVQDRLKNGELRIRMIFEGYGTATENQAKMAELEGLGIDVRYLGRSVKVHHKFAVIDSHGARDRVITGSANWSLSSYRNYNENILFLENENEATARYKTEFQRLWKAAKEFGTAFEYEESGPVIFQDEENIEVFFNTARRLKTDHNEPSNLTEQVVRLIDSAEEEISIASTRIRLVPILDAILNAANRGVKIQIVINQDDYRDLESRAHWLLEHENIELRVKFFNLRPSQYMVFQMHNKFAIIDRKIVLTGSFNWSASSETRHFENLIELSAERFPNVLEEYLSEFQLIWSMNREGISDLKQSFAESREMGQLPKCGFKPTVFRYEEINEILTENPRCK